MTEMMIGSVVWSRDEVVQDHWRQGSQAVCWRGGPHKVLKSTRVRGESLGERKTTDSRQGLNRGGAESETALAVTAWNQMVFHLVSVSWVLPPPPV